MPAEPRRRSAPQGRTTQRREDTPEPRLPHEHDESSDSQVGVPTPVGRQAHADAESGIVDTDKGPVADAVYRRQKQRR